MRKVLFGAGALLALALISGCGGAGSTAGLLNAYRGNYTGTWTSAVLNDGGNVTMLVQADGSSTGTMTITSTNGTGNLVGSVSGTGQFDAQVGFGASGNYVISGTVSQVSGQLLGNYTITWQGNTYPAQMTLTPAAGG